MEENRRRDVVGDVPDNDERTVDNFREIDFEDITLDDCNPLIPAIPVAQPLGELMIYLDGNHAPGASEQLLGKRSSARPYLDHNIVAPRLGRFGDILERGPVVEKMLAESLEYGWMGSRARHRSASKHEERQVVVARRSGGVVVEHLEDMSKNLIRLL